MRWMRAVVMLGAVLGLGLVTPTAWAQASAAPCVPGGGASFVAGELGLDLEPRSGAPFTAEVTTTFDQALADGNSIHTVWHSRRARDASGRTMSEMAMGCARGEDGQLHPTINISVNDPGAKASLSWQVNQGGPKIVRVFHQEAPPNRTVTPAAQAAMLAQRKLMESQPHKGSDGESLGTKTIQGVAAEGTRTTRTIPAGEQGNALPLKIVHEVWRSTELGLILVTIDDDPRRGRTTVEIDELHLGEPDAALFTPPADYEVQEMHPHTTQ
jgi:hypothetical protein